LTAICYHLILHVWQPFTRRHFTPWWRICNCLNCPHCTVELLFKDSGVASPHILETILLKRQPYRRAYEPTQARAKTCQEFKRLFQARKRPEEASLRSRSSSLRRHLVRDLRTNNLLYCHVREKAHVNCRRKCRLAGREKSDPVIPMENGRPEYY